MGRFGGVFVGFLPGCFCRPEDPVIVFACGWAPDGHTPCAPFLLASSLHHQRCVEDAVHLGPVPVERRESAVEGARPFTPARRLEGAEFEASGEWGPPLATERSRQASRPGPGRGARGRPPGRRPRGPDPLLASQEWVLRGRLATNPHLGRIDNEDAVIIAVVHDALDEYELRLLKAAHAFGRGAEWAP